MEYFWEDFGWIFKAIAGVALVVLGIHACNNTDAAKALKAQTDAADRADQLPRVIREVDGCKVYAFKGGDHWHYFTRCQTQTTTDTTIVERHGKTTSERIDSIVTNNSN